MLSPLLNLAGVKFTLVIIIGLLLSHLLRAHISEEVQLIAISAIVLLVPSLLIDVAKHTADAKKQVPLTWPLRIAGAGLVLLCACMVTGVVKL